MPAGPAGPAGPVDPAEATAVGENPEPPSAPTGATRLLLVRHAVTPYTEAGRVDGRGGADPDLSETGRQQAEQAAEAVRALDVVPCRAHDHRGTAPSSPSWPSTRLTTS